MRRRHVDTHAHAGPLADTTRGRGRVLAALKMQSPIPTRELAYLLDIRQQSLNDAAKKLPGRPGSSSAPLPRPTGAS